MQFYELRVAATEINLPEEIEDVEAMEELLTARAGRRVRILVPQRGDKRALVELATRNAELSYRTRFNETTAAHFDALETLRSRLNLPAIPRRIDCFDISTIQGSDTVASMVVCEDGRMKRSEYRKFRVRGLRSAGVGPQSAVVGPQSTVLSPQSAVFDPEPQTPNPESRIPNPEPRIPNPESRIPDPGPRIPDDFAAMREVVQRRYRAVLEGGGPFPDLILIDGGKGQLSAAYEALEQIGLANLVAVGIAKKEELLFTRDRMEPLVLDEHDPALLLLQRIRDEAHRFAVTFHRKARSMRDLRSELDGIPGIGPRRRRALLTTFGSLAGVRRATREELEHVVGANAARAVIDYFAQTSR
jgi:excinuclease ABC subunit C